MLVDEYVTYCSEGACALLVSTAKAEAFCS
jgi:hypothetical protein